jgi:hypothetical protein
MGCWPPWPADGGFTIRLPNANEYALYKQKLILVDRDGDGHCSKGDEMVVDFAAPVQPMTITLTPATGPWSWGRQSPTAEECALIEGWSRE